MNLNLVMGFPFLPVRVCLPVPGQTGTQTGVAFGEDVDDAGFSHGVLWIPA